MKIEHIAMYVRDLEGAKAFFEKYFNAKPGDIYHNKTSDFKSYFYPLTMILGLKLLQVLI